ncbi:Glycosyltransferase 2-like [Candidatus Nanopelagicaceae bacterium]
MNQNLIEILRKERLILENELKSDSNLTVYVGIYNGAKFLDGVQIFLNTSSLRDFNLIIVDNSSSDGSWEVLENWIGKFAVPTKVVRNPINLGGGGGFELNKDLLQTEWVTFIHQDAKYGANHLETLFSAALRSSSEVIAVSTEMGSMREDGSAILSIARPIWLAESSNKASFFLANLRTHLVPWGSTIFKTREFLSIELPWHSSAFPDTELLLRLCAKGKFINLPVQTMCYRENLVSESHGLSGDEKDLAIVAALSRVFASPEFIDIARTVEGRKRKDYYQAIKDGIALRLKRAELRSVAELIAEESLLIAWNYSYPELVGDVSSRYSEMGSNRVSELLDSILAHVGEFETGRMNMFAQAQLKESGDLLIPERRALNSFLKIFPYSQRRKFLKALLWLKVRTKKNHPNDFGW